MITLEKKCKFFFFFVEKNKAQISGFAVTKKANKIKKIQKKKRKKSCSLFVQILSSKWCVEIYLKRS